MHIKISFLLFLIYTASSCTTLLNAPTKKVHVYATQSNTYVTYKDSTYNCPAQIKIPRSYEGDTLVVSHESSYDTVLLRAIISPIYLFNGISYGIGYFIDPFTPKVCTYNQPLFLDFTKNEIVSTWRKPRIGTTIFSAQCPLLYAFISNPSDYTSSGALEFRIDHYITPYASVYIKGSQFTREHKLSLIRAEFGVSAIIREQFGLAFGTFMGHFAHEASPREFFWGGSTELPEINSNVIGLSCEIQRYLIRGFYSFASYSCGYTPTHNLYIHILEFGYGIRLNPDFIKTKR